MMQFNSPQQALDKFKLGEITVDECLAVIRAFPVGLEIPKDCLKYPSIQQQIASESNEKFELIGYNFTGQFSVLIKDAMFPLKTIITSKILGAINIVKSLFIEPIRLLSTWYYAPVVAYTFIRRKHLEKTIDSFNRLAWRVISEHILNDEHVTKVSQEVCFNVFTFLHKYGITESKAFQFAETVGIMVEFDNAYRFRLQDIMMLTSKEQLLENPRKEINRLFTVFAQRDINEAVISKFRNIVKLLTLALWIPKVRKSFEYMVNEMHLQEYQFDDADLYWACLRRDYHVLGMNYEQRQEFAKNQGWIYPKQI